MPTPAVRRHQVKLDGDVELDVLEAGNRGDPVLVLAHGFPEGAWSWRHQLAAFADEGWHVLAPYQRGYGASHRPDAIADYGVRQLTGDLLALVEARAGVTEAVYVGHDWGAMIVWELARLHPERVRAVVGVSVPFVQSPGPPTQMMRMIFGDRFFYMLYFQQVGPPEAELEADLRRTMSSLLWGGSGPGRPDEISTDLPPMEGTGFLTRAPTPPPLPWSGPEGVWMTEDELDRYVADFATSGFFGPVSYYRNLDANYEVVKELSSDRVSMPSYFIAGERDVVLLMDPHGVERMTNLLSGFCGHTLIPGAGHWVQQEAPLAFDDALHGFLTTLD